jgi:hypothetical protein
LLRCCCDDDDDDDDDSELEVEEEEEGREVEAEGVDAAVPGVPVDDAVRAAAVGRGTG